MTDRRYIFLLSSDRSGSNLLLRLMGAHSEVTAPPTSQLLPNLYKAHNQYLPFSHQPNWNALLNHTQALHQAGFGDWQCYADLHSVLSKSPKRSVQAILETIFETEAEATKSNIIAVKAHKAFNYAGALKTDFPEAKFIHLTRDPRDMALSWLNTPALRGGVVRAADIWKEEQSELLRLESTFQPQFHRLRYEDILLKPKPTLEKLCTFLEIAFEPDMLQFHQQNETRNIAGHVQAWNNLAKPLMSQNQSKYKSGLTLDQRAYIENVCGPEMSQLDYMPDLDPQDFDLDSIASYLKEDEPWDKPAYAELSQAERESHVVLREAVRRLMDGPPPSKSQ